MTSPAAPDPLDPRVARILDKLARVRARGVATFGAEAHGFVLAPPLAEAEVRALEAAHGIALPEDYRTFLLQAGASGAGPYYGLLPPARWDEARVDDTADFAARPCVWEPGTPRDDETYAARTASLDEPFQGAIAIADQGCAYYVTLVVTGPARGRLMYVSLDGGVPFFPENADFLSWYERWLDELLWGYTHFWYGTQMPGDEATLAEAARADDGPRRLDALAAMGQLPALSVETQAIVARRVGDRDAPVRAAALRLARAHALVPAIEADVRRALADDDAAVRVSALDALIAAGCAWEADARRALGDPAEQVVTDAVRALQKAAAFGEADVLALLPATSARVRATVLDVARTVPSRAIFDAVLAIARAGDDPYDKLLLVLIAQVRHGVLDRPRLDAALAMVLARLAVATGPEAPAIAIHGLAAFVPTHPVALARLCEVTRHAEPFFRWEAIAALASTGSADALPALRALVDDPAMPRAANHSTAWSVGEQARRAIERIEQARARRS